ncbi:MAG: tRNA (adenosine(37)-N6)-dimethylallyltransferase MiaA [Desulfobacteraceae bacterium]|nr:tRNA (adenosine(37)-N6)-dimethylallyltransferase MiaA [Desulfobacteraceae bacterium]MCB9494834.1 tRNA (adenosine(37)-N6)-dimethylallyltransferase MiaA [Desulfobacteraceae bacterium]
MAEKLPKIVIICGPTGIGKTSMTIELFSRFPSIIISADSMQVYKHMDIGTAKPTPEENKKAFHYLTDICLPDEEFDAGKFAQEADKLIEKAHSDNKISIIAGGTGLYIKALTQGIFRSHPADKEALQSLYELEKKNGSGFLKKLLETHDPDSASKIHENDIFRLARALECFFSTGQKMSELQEKDRNSKTRKYKTLKIGLYMEREILYQRIEARVDQMIKNGLLEEVINLREMGYSQNLKSMSSIGYKHMNLVIDRELSLDEAVSLMKRDTRRYAKRQLTWFRSDKEINWLLPHETDKAAKLIDNFIKT